MKRRNLILSFVAIALLLIGLGYAALTDTLTVTGSVSTTTADLVLQFTGEKTDDTEGPATGSVTVAAKAKTATVSVEGLQNVGDSVTVTIEFTNASAQDDMDAKDVAAQVAAGYNTEYFLVTAETSATTLAVGAKATVTITVELVKSVNAADISTDFTVTVTGTMA